jgi:tetratricopeptide (TPR) repeat protein
MSDPLRTDRVRAVAAASEPDKDAKIEQLLLTGLDHFFASEYEQAINVWTRALFLDRSHARTRAYIERARSALAERQRESEELLQHGAAALERGAGGEARRLLEAALHQGAPSDQVLVMLDRVTRLEQSETAVHQPGGAARDLPIARTQTAAPFDVARHRTWILAATGAAVAAAAIVVAATLADWRPIVALGRPPVRPAALDPIVEPPLPLPRRAERELTRAQAAAAAGRLHEALGILDRVQPTDPERPDADRLRATVQRQLIELLRIPAGPTPAAREPQP